MHIVYNLSKIHVLFTDCFLLRVMYDRNHIRYPVCRNFRVGRHRVRDRWGASPRLPTQHGREPRICWGQHSVGDTPDHTGAVWLLHILLLRESVRVQV